ncbi:MAG: response regulator [Planctomycetes bacterium]|nr:response regulator [Planctomycetota bacterium]
MAAEPAQELGLFQRVGVKVISAALALVCVSLVLQGLHTVRNEQQLLGAQLDARGNALARLGASSCVELLLGHDYPLVETMVAGILREDPDIVYVRVEDAAGSLVREAHRPDATAEAQEGLVNRYDAEIALEASASAAGESKRLGRMILGLSTRPLMQLRVERAKTLVLQAGLAFAVFSVLLWAVLRRTVMRPLSSLDAQAARLGSGDLDTPIRLAQRDELGRLATTLERMRVNLSDSYSEIRARNRELTLAHEEKDAALAELRRALEVKGEFLATMSHEVRTPLNAVIGMTQLLLETPLDAEQREYVEAVASSGEGLKVIVNDILDFSKMSAQRVTLEHVPVDLRVMARELFQILGVEAGRKALAFECTVDAQVPRAVLADPYRLRQVALNLLTNAVKFTPSGGVSFTIELDRLERRRAWLRVSVADTGIGLPDDAHEKLFQPFTQADNSTARRFGGTGLGLAISKHLATLMGGEIGFRRNAPRGTVFWFTFAADVCSSPSIAPEATDGAGPATLAPFVLTLSKTAFVRLPVAPPAPLPTRVTSSSGAPAPSPDSAPASAAPGPRANTARILLVEDNVVNQRLAMRMLTKLGHEVTLAVNGAEAVESASQQSFDLILMDVSMPLMDGFEATRRIRQSETGHTPIVALTANTMEGDRERCLQAGMDAFVGKPVVQAQLVEVIEFALARVRSTEA